MPPKGDASACHRKHARATGDVKGGRREKSGEVTRQAPGARRRNNTNHISRALPLAHAYVVAARKDLADLYDAWGKPEKAAEWRAKLAEMEEEPGPE